LDESKLDIWAWLNVEMDKNAKAEWQKEWVSQDEATLQSIPVGRYCQHSK